MKIIGMEIFPITISFKKVIAESMGAVGKKEYDTIIRVYTDEGVSGLGEAMTVIGPSYQRESQGTVIEILAKYLFPGALEGQSPFNVDVIHQRMDKVAYDNTVAKSAVDISLYDIIGKVLGVPVYQLLGGCFAQKIPLRGAIGIDTPERMAEESREWIKAGFSAIKMKAGLNIPLDIKRVEAVRKAIGPDLIINVDINCAYLPKEAIYFGKRVEEFSPIWIEQPTNRDDIEGMALVRKNVAVPVGACESAVTLTQILRVIRMEAADYFNYKIDRSGGFFRGKQAVHMIDTAGLFIVGSSDLGLGINLAAEAHFAVSTSCIKQHSYGAGILRIAGAYDTRNIEGDVVVETPKIENGFLEVPTKPGLGVELNEEAVKKLLTSGRSPMLVGRRSK